MSSQKKLTRRQFLNTSAIAASATLTLPQLRFPAEAGVPEAEKHSKRVILFQGDSITDAGRRKKAQAANDAGGLGMGYANLVASTLTGQQPASRWQCYNRGISGNKVFQLAERWQKDCLDLKPDILSLLIGVNDFWHTLTHNYTGTVATYQTDLRKLLERTRYALPDCKFIIGEPFAVAGGSAINKAWTAGFKAYRHAAHEVATEFKAVWIPYHSLFDEALKLAPVSHWCPDGVHPSPAGNHLMASALLKAIAKLG